MRNKELIKELQNYNPDLEVVFNFDGLETGNIDISVYRNKLLIDIDYLELAEDEYYESY